MIQNRTIPKHSSWPRAFLTSCLKIDRTTDIVMCRLKKIYIRQQEIKNRLSMITQRRNYIQTVKHSQNWSQRFRLYPPRTGFHFLFEIRTLLLFLWTTVVQSVRFHRFFFSFTTTDFYYLGITLSVYRLDAEITKEYLKEIFSAYGHVMSCSITEEGPVPYRMGSIVYYSPLEAQQAIRYMNGKTILNSKVYVGLQARKKERRRSSNNRTSPPSSVRPMIGGGTSGVVGLEGVQTRTERSKSELVVTTSSLHTIPPNHLQQQLQQQQDKTVGEKLIQFKRLCRTRSLNPSMLNSTSY